MKRLLLAGVALFLLGAPAWAANNTVVITPGSGVTMRSFDIGAGVEAMGHIIVDSAGAAIYGTAGTANAAVLSIQGIASGTQLGIKAVSGAIASGALAAGSLAAGALATGAGVDGWDLTQGAKADSAWVSGSGSVIAILKTIATSVSAGGAVTVADGADVAQGAVADSAYAGSGNTTVVAALKGIYSAVVAGGANSVISSPLGSATTATAAVSTTDTGTPITGQSLSAGGEGMKGWLSQIYAAANSAVPAGTADIGLFHPLPSTSGGLVAYPVFQPTASDNHQTVKNGAGQVYSIVVTNISSTINYIRLYNAASGFNGCNSATGALYQVAIPANSTNAGGIMVDIPHGIAFSTGISLCVTSGIALTDTTNATAASMSVNIGYK